MKTEKPTTKIIAGKYKGKVLELPSLDVTRSSKSMLKESLFNVQLYPMYGIKEYFAPFSISIKENGVSSTKLSSKK